tara:strand:+ start:4102 stop:5274 length:1173 start_codon:yes stop_codon:yes gene_type:complete
MTKNGTAHPGVWFVIFASLFVALSAFLSRIQDETRLQFREEKNFTCEYVTTDFSRTNSTATSSKPDELTAILATAIALTAFAAVAHALTLYAVRSPNPLGYCNAAEKTMDSMLALVINTLVLATAFVALGFTYTVAITTKCDGQWADPRFNDVTAVIGVSTAYAGLLVALGHAIIENSAQKPHKGPKPQEDSPGKNTRSAALHHASRLLLATALTAQFAFSAEFFGADLDKYDNLIHTEGCDPSAATKDNFAWVVLCATTSIGLLWALLIARDFAVYMMCPPKPKPTPPTNEVVHLFQPWHVSYLKLPPWVQGEALLFCIRLIGMPVALNTMFLTRVVDVTCLPLAHKLSSSPDDLHWHIFALVFGDFLIFAYAFTMSTVTHTPLTHMVY